MGTVTLGPGPDGQVGQMVPAIRSDRPPVALGTPAGDVRLWPASCLLLSVTPGGGGDVCSRISGPRRRRARPASVPVAMAGEVVPGHSALRRPGLPVAGVR